MSCIDRLVRAADDIRATQAKLVADEAALRAQLVEAEALRRRLTFTQEPQCQTPDCPCHLSPQERRALLA